MGKWGGEDVFVSSDRWQLFGGWRLLICNRMQVQQGISGFSQQLGERTACSNGLLHEMAVTVVASAATVLASPTPNMPVVRTRRRELAALTIR